MHTGGIFDHRASMPGAPPNAGHREARAAGTAQHGTRPAYSLPNMARIVSMVMNIRSGRS